MNFEAMLLSQINDVEIEPEIIKIAEDLKNTSLFPNLSDEDYNRVLDLAVQTLNTRYGESYIVKTDTKSDPWFNNYYKDLGITRWDRYVDYLKQQKKFAPKVINGMQENLFKIIDLVGNPSGENFSRRGLVIGDVQSGKTANYVGLMNLATDAKFKLMIVLTGTTNTLREQTQIRIEEGLGKANLKKGVSVVQDIRYEDFEKSNPIYLTSEEHDFNLNSRKNFQLSIETTKVPIVIVTKKNSTALKNIYNWLEEYSLDQRNNRIDSSLLLIDDEADFASVNTKDDEDNPTIINSRIRQILGLFTKSSYLGFTATPYANIFINPENNDEMYGLDLFPRDYIYVLGESEKYIGVQRIFGEEKNADHKDMLVEIYPEELETYLPLKHKKDYEFYKLSPSMEDALNLFFLANVVRDLRGDLTAHRSMLINVSRFTLLHSDIKDIVLEYVNRVKRDIRLNGKLPIKEAIKKETISNLNKSFNKHYSNLKEKYSFDELLKLMNDSIHNITVSVINQSNKEMNYMANEEIGERVIVIGGFSLSRGLTLEGLMISYYYRNSVMYDSLLQMGRWFGYRNNYEDLCKIYMTLDTISDFKFIALATQELKDDLKINSNRGSTPKEFGIKVRSGQTGLIITSRNKMRTGKQITTSIDFNKDIIETTCLSVKDIKTNLKNSQVIQNLIKKNSTRRSSSLDPNNKNISEGLVDVDKSEIIQFLKDFTPVNGSKFDSELIIKWLRSNTSEILNKWDIAFAKGSNKELKYNYGYGIEGATSIRTMIKVGNQEGIYKNSNSRLGSPSDGRLGLDDEQYDQFNKKYKDIKTDKTVSQKFYFDYELNRKPIIVIYSVVPQERDEKELYSEYIPMLSIGIPDLGTGRSEVVEYTVNKIYQDLDTIEVIDE